MRDAEDLYKLLSSVMEGRAYYGTNAYDESHSALPPFAVYSEVSKRVASSGDNRPIYYVSTYQVTLVTERKDPSLEKRIESALLKADYVFSMTAEYRNEDKTNSRVYEIKMEEYIDA